MGFHHDIAEVGEGTTPTPEPPFGPFRVTLRLDGIGFMQMVATADDQHVERSSSYIFDGVEATGSALVALARGATAVRFSWFDEPGEYRWVVNRDGEEVRVVLREFPDWSPRRVDEQGEAVLETRCDLLRFLTQFRGQLQQLRNDHPGPEFERLWHNPFPDRKLAQLTEAITQLKSERRSGRG